MNVILVWCGPHSQRIYFKFLKKYKIIPSILVDLESKRDEVLSLLQKLGFASTKTFFIPDEYKDLILLPSVISESLLSMIRDYKITHAIISTEPKAHYSYAKFFIENNINILMDKPITAPINVISDITQTEKIKEDFDALCEDYLIQKKKNPGLLFSIQCQRRFHAGYIYVKKILKEIVLRYNIPITYIDVYHSDGMWNMPDEFVFRENHPYKYGYGKMFHSGYHFIDLLTRLLEVNVFSGKEINQASVYAEKKSVLDFLYTFDNQDYKKIFNTDKYDKYFLEKRWFSNYWELDIHSILNFYNDKTLITTCSINLMQSWFSRRSWIDLPQDTYKWNGRVRHERLNINVWPLLNIQIHSYQAYEVKNRSEYGWNNPWDIEHFDILIFRNSDIIWGSPFEKIQLSDIEKRKCEDFIGYNELARERCFLDFIKNKENDSNILLHQQSIDIIKNMYTSIVLDWKKVMFDFNCNNSYVMQSLGIITDKDFWIVEKKHNNPPVIRFWARWIVVNNAWKIAIINKIKKKEYKLPGGGIDEGEEPKLAFIRECREELGCDIELLDDLGTIEEYKSQENFKQISFVFIAKQGMVYWVPSFTKQEQDEGAQFLWLDPQEALKQMKESLTSLESSDYDSIYRTQFMVARDIKILESYLATINE